MPRLLRSLSLFLALGAGVVAACGESEEPTVLQKVDFEPPEGEAPNFDKENLRNDLMTDAELTDSETIELRQIEEFFKKTPYGGRSSFLETYQSNGVRAADAIVATARQYKLNPLVLLVFVQATQGLVGERFYPIASPPRVEYVFRCGCTSGRTCAPELAGFDRQVECLGRRLRSALDEVRANGATTAGWGVTKTMTTLDGVKVSPKNAATAVLYDYLPRLNKGKAGGTWILWNIFNRYKLDLQYSGPIGSADGAWVGDACQNDAVCSTDIESGEYPVICAPGPEYPDGMCTRQCAGECPQSERRGETFCAKFDEGAYCLIVCNLAAPNCRPGYECRNVSGVGAGDAKPVCLPKPQ